MPTPVDRNTPAQTTSGYYDTDGDQCVGPTAASRKSSSSTPAASTTEGDQASRAAVDQLVKGASAHQRGSCASPVAEAALTCAAAALVIAASTATGPGALAAVAIAGATCGVKVMSAEECLEP